MSTRQRVRAFSLFGLSVLAVLSGVMLVRLAGEDPASQALPGHGAEALGSRSVPFRSASPGTPQSRSRRVSAHRSTWSSPTPPTPRYP